MAVVFASYALLNGSLLFDYSVYYIGRRWPPFFCTLFLALAAASLSRKPALRRSASWLGLTLLLQALLTPLLIDQALVSLPPNFATVIDVRGGLPGISGIQHVTTDSHGFRVTSPSDDSISDALRIFAIGGSTTEQIYLDDARTWSALLERQLAVELQRPVRVANTGVSGLRAINHLATLESILQFEPDAAIFLLGLNDWNIHLLRVCRPGWGPTLASPALLRAHELVRRISLRQSALFLLLKRLSPWDRSLTPTAGGTEDRPLVETGEFYDRLRGSLYRLPQVPCRIEDVDPLYDATLRRILDRCREASLRCIFVTQPSGYDQRSTIEFRRNFWMTPPFADFTVNLAALEHVASLYNAHLETRVAEYGFPVCDVAAQIEPSGDFYYDDAHLNTAGAEAMSRALLPCVGDSLRAGESERTRSP